MPSVDSPTTADSEAWSLLEDKAKSLQDKMKRSRSSRLTVQATTPSNTSTDEASTNKKGTPLKLGKTLGETKRERRVDTQKQRVETSTDQAELQARLVREQEAEKRLLEMLSSDSASLNRQSSTSAVATLQLEDSTAASGAVEPANISSNVSLFDMSGSSIMQDNQANWGDDVSLSMLVDSTMTTSTTSSSDAHNAADQTITAEASLDNNIEEPPQHGIKTSNDRDTTDTDTQQHQPASEDILTDTTANIPEVAAFESITTSVYTCQKTVSIQYDDPATLVEKDVDTCDDNKPVEETENIGIDCDTSSVDVANPQQTDYTATSDTSQSTEKLLDKSSSFVMDDSQTSASSVDDLSSSNRTLTTEDLLSLDTSSTEVMTTQSANDDDDDTTGDVTDGCAPQSLGAVSSDDDVTGCDSQLLTGDDEGDEGYQPDQQHSEQVRVHDDLQGHSSRSMMYLIFRLI